jgi:hypothetical protein
VRLGKLSETILRLMAGCIVSFVDVDGIRHPGGLTQLEVEVRSSVKHTLTVTKTREWLQRA